MSEAIELEQWWADIADELGVQAAYLHVHGMDWRGRTDGNEVVARAVATIARLTAEIATFQAMMLDCETEGDKAREALSELRARVEAAVDYLEVVGDAMYKCVFCGAKKKELCHRPGCKVTAALAILAPPEAPTDKGGE